jgi:hypothetical protein
VRCWEECGGVWAERRFCRGLALWNVGDGGFGLRLEGVGCSAEVVWCRC